MFTESALDLTNGHPIFVDYVMPKSKELLEVEFSVDQGSDLFFGNQWEYHPSCVGVNTAPCVRSMYTQRFHRANNAEEVIIEMAKLGYRPATHLELYAYIKARNNGYLPWISALGSYTVSRDRRQCAISYQASGGYTFTTCSYGCGTCMSRDYLLVYNP